MKFEFGHKTESELGLNTLYVSGCTQNICRMHMP